MEGTEQENVHFRVSICLKEFFSDERASCYLSVNGRRPVSWLHQRLRRLFPLPVAFCLQLDGHLLPPDEPLALLRPDDRVIAMPTRNKECFPAGEMDHSDLATHSNGDDRSRSWDKGEHHTVDCYETSVAGVGGEEGDARGAGDEAGALREAKRRALAELDACGPPARRARRRVRRRRPRTADEGGAPADTDTQDQEGSPSPSPGPTPPWPSSPHRPARGPPGGVPSPGCRSRHMSRPPSPEVFVRHRGHVLHYPGLQGAPQHNAR